MNDFEAYLDEALVRVELPTEDTTDTNEKECIDSRIGRIIHSMRFANNITLSELSKKSGVSVREILRIESGNTLIKMATLEKLAKAMGKQLIIEFKNIEEDD